MGYKLQLSGKPTEALAAFKRALVIQQKLADANPNVTDLQYWLSRIHEYMGWVLRQTGDLAEALAAFERAIAIAQPLADANPSVTRWQSQLAINLSYAGTLKQKAGRTVEAVVSYRRAVAIWMRQSSRTPYDLYNLCCSHAKLASLADEPGSGITAVEGRAEADRAIDWLLQAVAGGYRKLAILRTDHDLDPLRSRPDFQLLMMDLEFPDDPFARGD
jgi:serine/threonine-protein kinase